MGVTGFTALFLPAIALLHYVIFPWFNKQQQRKRKSGCVVSRVWFEPEIWKLILVCPGATCLAPYYFLKSGKWGHLSHGRFNEIMEVTCAAWCWGTLYAHLKWCRVLVTVCLVYVESVNNSSREEEWIGEVVTEWMLKCNCSFYQARGS